jgi:hypothetical protein
MATPRADPARQRGAGKGPSPARRSPPPERQAARAARRDTPEGGELIEEERSMPQFITVATTDELADQQAKLVEVEDQKIALFRVDGGFYALATPAPIEGDRCRKGR